MAQLDDTLKDSFLSALDEERYDDLLFLMANLLRARQGVVSVLARAALPVDKDLCQPLLTNRLTHQEIEAFNLRAPGWHIITVHHGRVVGAEPFPYTVKDQDYRARIEDYVQSVDGDRGEEPMCYGAYFRDNRLLDIQHLYEFRPECRAG